MSCAQGWKKTFFITLLITPFLFLITQTPAMAFGPQICDVTTKAFSVVWTTGSPYTNVGITNTSPNIPAGQILVETSPGQPGQNNQGFGIVKVTAVGLNYNTTYTFTPYDDSGNKSPLTVKTERLWGIDTNDPNVTDIVSNDVVHKAVYQSNGTSPALGALVLADIYDSTDTEQLSDYPVSAWVGDGMLGDGSSSDYDPNNISYQQYAALNMNNLFGTNHYPLSLNGDDPATTTVNESEFVRFTIVHGTQSIYPTTSVDYFTSKGRIESVDKAEGDGKITTAKISASFKFSAGITPFAFPFFPPSEYTTVELVNAIDEAEGAWIVDAIYVYQGGWKTTSRNKRTGIVQPAYGLGPGEGCFIELGQDMTKEVIFYGKPNSVEISLVRGTINMISLPQLPAYYNTGDFLNDIELKGGAGTNTVEAVFSYSGGWKTTAKNPRTGQIPVTFTMSNTKAYAVKFKPEATTDVVDWDPFVLD